MQLITDIVRHIRQELNKVVIGQERLISETLATLLCNGHALIEGVPGLAKTLTVKAVAEVLSTDFRRIQGSSDLLPSDILGTNIFDAATGSFHVHKGAIFTDLLLADEINRMPPRTQAALLEAMEERQVSMDGISHPLSPAFTVFATQNPVEFEGTYPLPEAQLDRFLLRIKVDYPDLPSEVEILRLHQEGSEASPLKQLERLPADSLAQARGDVAKVQVEPRLLEYVAKLTRKTREWPTIELGASPRAGIALLKVAKAFATFEERDFVVPDDIKAAALPVLGHRIVLKPEAELEGTTPESVLEQVTRSVEVPR